MSILDICENGDVLSVLRIVNIVITIIKIGVPIILILSLMIDYMNAVKDHDSDALAKTNRLAVKRVIASILIFMIPTFVLVIVDTVDPGNRTYLSCMNDATTENINAAYRLMAEKHIDKARETLRQYDFQIAENSVSRIKDENDKAELTRELEELRSYVQIREAIYEVASNFDREKLAKIKEQIAAISDPEMKEQLTKELTDAVGSKGSIAGYSTDPDDEIYRNLQNFSGKTLETVLQEHGSSVAKLEAQIYSAVEAAGIGTRQAPVAAALTLIETLADYGYRINYDWGGKWSFIGVDGKWGKKITPQYCDSHPNPDRCKSQLIWKGLDCSGFVNWALVQGFHDENYPRQYTQSYGAISLSGQTTAICNMGDTIVNDGHITLVVGHDDSRSSYIVAESTGGGVKLSYYNYNNSSYYCKHIDYKN